ncbi:quaternary amine ABC transporter ATP-binding protein [Celeribacter indicus]|uniref:Quaternary amine transport ATP-binding protein n=1 Tax=Celeribacter indicus TaxID=1208324 RepID=A0A0B5DZP2_9RHOB|nr:glycine betaine/L-proline ABC transporter ATP-binding protein [Celeribacter indicus]AJE45647.1 ABC transporter permease [Celeribacter indicus]SDW83726.1 glycine betaine/proline transport system ATP-binding protein [Celeribacter indicus]
MTDATQSGEEVKVSIRNLYKIFGSDPMRALEEVKAGMTKAELMEHSTHALGLRDINLDIHARKLQVIMGLSGSGKSTLIRHLNRLIEPTAGEIWVDGEDVLAMDDKALRDLRRFKMSMVFQKFGLLPHRTVLENAKYGLEIQGVEKAEAETRARKWLDRVGLSGFEGQYPNQLSGGQQQRVGLARALATDAEILLMDEAFSALDPLIRTDMQSILLELQEELHKTIIFITHDLDEALRIADRIAILRDGEIVQSGDPQKILMKPADDYITDFIKDVNRAKVVRLRSIVTPGETATGPELKGRMSIEEALPILHKAPEGKCPVVDVEGRPLGAVTLDAAIEALKAPESAGEEMRYA